MTGSPEQEAERNTLLLCKIILAEWDEYEVTGSVRNTSSRSLQLDLNAE